MTWLWVYLSVTLVFGEKLERVYLPPLGYASSGGSEGALDVPLELPKFSFLEEYIPKNNEIAIGIDRSSPYQYTTNVSENLAAPKEFSIISENQDSTDIPVGFTVNSEEDFSKNTEIAIGIDRGGPYQTIDLFENVSTLYNDKQFTIPNTNNFANIYSTTSSYPELVVNNYENFKYNNISNPTITDYPNLDQTTYDKNLSPLLHNNKFSYGDVSSGHPKTTLSPFEVDSITNNNADSRRIDAVTYPLSTNSNVQQYNFISSTTPFILADKSYSTNNLQFSSTTQKNLLYKGQFNQAISLPDTERVQAESDRQAVILNYDQVRTPGSYAYNFDTSNGIHGNENGTTINGVKAEGSYSYVGDDGEVYSIIYTADENGFQPRGAHLPTSPPIPDAILKVIEKVKKKEESGAYDDGSYDDNKYGYRKYQTRIENLQQQILKNNNIPTKTNKVDLFSHLKKHEKSYESKNFNQHYDYESKYMASEYQYFPPENRFYDDKTLKTFQSRFSDIEQNSKAETQEFVKENVTAKPFLTPYVSRQDDNIENYDSENYKDSELSLTDELEPNNKLVHTLQQDSKDYLGYFYNKNSLGSTIPTNFPSRFSSTQTNDFSDVASLTGFDLKTTTDISVYSDQNRETATTEKSVDNFLHNPRQNQGFDPLTGYYY